MKKHEIEAVIAALTKNLNESEQMWKDNLPHAQIVGYLQGTIKGVVSCLEAKAESIKK